MPLPRMPSSHEFAGGPGEGHSGYKDPSVLLQPRLGTILRGLCICFSHLETLVNVPYDLWRKCT